MIKAWREKRMFTSKDRHSADIVGLLGKGTSFEGKLFFEGTVRIDGAFSGEVATQGLLVIGDEAVVHAQISAETIIIRGEHHGDITVSKAVEIRGKGKLYGDIHTPRLIVDSGAVFEGNSVMTGEEKADNQISESEGASINDPYTEKNLATA
ncbi:MAG TPA: polymer-forming cytoskeletal protein [Deltaproteobacteria bacterium]|nr:polymer-forming cytoskeletal protein [Deltaproteobacteria bacterium]